MHSVKHTKSILLFLVLFHASLSFALSETVAQLIEWETQGNAVSERSPAPFAVQHYEVPLSMLEQDFAKNLDPRVRKSLIFTKNGEDYVRWVINPEDTKWHLELQRHLISRGLDARPKKFFTGYLTASRSMIVEDPNGTIAFSIKVSTNQTGGHWKDKKQPIDDARQVRMVSDYVDETAERMKFKYLVIQNEPLLLGLKDVDQALLVRSLADLTDNKVYYLPGFSAVHGSVGREIALKNGSTDPAKFWNEHYNKALANALAEMAARFGITYDSPHSQNFLVELDKNFKPTGRIVVRDFGDSYAMEEWFQALGQLDFLKRWEQDNIVRGEASHGRRPSARQRISRLDERQSLQKLGR